MRGRLLLILLLVVVSGCTSESDARRALAGAGYTQVRITGYRFFACARDDDFSTGFEAIGPTGNPVTGVVCSGWLKGSTIRTD